MKTCAIKHLRQEGMKVEDIADIVFGNKKQSDDVVYHLKYIQPLKEQQIIEENWQKWIEEKVYPISKKGDYYSEFNQKGYFKLENR